MNDSLDENAKNIWINQTAPVLAMPIDEMRRRVQRSKSKARREHIVGIVAVISNLVAAAIGLAFDHPVRTWMNFIQVSAIVVWFLYSTRAYASAWNSILTLNLSSRSTPCLEFYRRELTLRRDRYRQNFRIIPVMIILLVPFLLRKYFLQGGVIFGLLLAFSMISYVRVKREAPRIQSEIDELNAFERRVSV